MKLFIKILLLSALALSSCRSYYDKEYEKSSKASSARDRINSAQSSSAKTR